MLSGTAEEPRISDICKATTTKHGSKKAGDIRHVPAGCVTRGDEMIASITIWVKGIIFVVLFASFLELLLPSNSMQRFVRVILGLFIMLTILQPVIGIMENKWTEDQLPALATRTGNSLIDTDILDAANQVVSKREQLTRDLYLRDLSKQIRATVLAIDGVADAKVTVELDSIFEPGSKGIGRIKKVVVYIEPGITAGERKIAKISVGPNAPETSEEPEKLHTTVIDKVKRAVSELYQLRSGQVEVKRLN